MFRRICTAAAFALALLAGAAEVQIAWDPNSESDLAGYRLYVYDASTNFLRAIQVGKVTTCTASNLQETTHLFDLTAFNTSGLESKKSLMISWVPTLRPVSIYRTVSTNWISQ